MTGVGRSIEAAFSDIEVWSLEFASNVPALVRTEPLKMVTRCRGHDAEPVNAWAARRVRRDPHVIKASVIAVVTTVNTGNPQLAISGTASALTKPPPMMGRVMSCR